MRGHCLSRPRHVRAIIATIDHENPNGRMKLGVDVVISSLRVSVDRLMDGIMTVTCAKGAGEL